MTPLYNDPLDAPMRRLGLPFRTTTYNCGDKAVFKYGGADYTNMFHCVEDLRKERQRMRFDADDQQLFAICHQGDRRDARLIWSVPEEKRPASVFVKGEDIGDALHRVAEVCSYSGRTLGLHRIKYLPIWLVVGRMEKWENWKGVEWDGMRGYSQGEPKQASMDWRLDALRRLFSPEAESEKGLSITFDGRPMWEPDS
jgi:hypothetical protein